RLLAAPHPHAADLRVEADVHLVLEDGRLAVRQRRQQPPQRLQFGLAERVLAAEDRPGPAPDQVGLVQPAADRLPADGQLVPTQQQPGDGGAGPAAAQEPELAGGALGDPAGTDGGPPPAEPLAAAGLPTSQRGDASCLKALLPAGDGTCGGEQDGGDGVPGVAFAQQQEDVGAAAGLGVGAAAVQAQQSLAFIG